MYVHLQLAKQWGKAKAILDGTLTGFTVVFVYLKISKFLFWNATIRIVDSFFTLQKNHLDSR